MRKPLNARNKPATIISTNTILQQTKQRKNAGMEGEKQMNESEKAWTEFVEGNPELISGFGDALALAFDAGWIAGKIQQKKEAKTE